MIKFTLIGALTSKPYQFNARSWELNNVETIDLFDSLNSNIKLNIRNSDILRVMPVNNEQINEEWISDKTRFAFDGLKRWRFIYPMIKQNGLFVETSWENALNFIKIKLTQTNYKNFIINSGNFSDIEAIVSLKDFSSKINNSKFSKTKYSFDFQEDFLLTEDFKKINSPKVIIIAGVNLRLLNPIFNIRLRKLSHQKNILIGYIGYFFNSTYKFYHLGSNLNVLKKIIEGKHWFCSDINKILGNNLKWKLKNDISFILGEDFFNKKKAHFIFDILKRHKSKFFNFKLNVLLPYSGTLNALELGFKNIVDIKSKGNNVYYLNGNEKLLNKLTKEDFVIFQGHHNDSIRTKINVILPSTTWVESNYTYLNCFGFVQKTKFALKPPIYARDNWKITQMLNFNLLNKFNYVNLENLMVSLEKKTPNLFNNIDFMKNPLFPMNINYKLKKVGFYSNTLIKTEKYNYYKLTTIERVSKIMNDCSSTLKKFKSNYIKIN